MKIHKFRVDVYDWEVYFVIVRGVRDLKKLRKVLGKIGVEKKDIDVSCDKVKKGMYDGGDSFTNTGTRVAGIVLYDPKEDMVIDELVCHEKRHVEDTILKRGGVEDVEASAYLAGYVGKMLFSFVH